MFEFLGYLRWLLIFSVLFNFIKAAPSLTSGEDNNNFIYHNIDATSQAADGIDDKPSLPDKRAEESKDFDSESRSLANYGWWPWVGMTPVRRSSFVPRLGKRTEEFSSPFTQNTEEHFEITPAEQEFLTTKADAEDDMDLEHSPLSESEDDLLLGRDTRSSYGFAPRLGKRTYSFSPRLGKRTFSFSPRLGKRTYSFAPRLGKKTSFAPRLGRTDFSFYPRLGKRAYSFSPRLGKRVYSFSPRLG